MAYIRLAARHVMVAFQSKRRKKKKQQRPPIRKVTLARLGHRTQTPELVLALHKTKDGFAVMPLRDFQHRLNQPGTLIKSQVMKPSACSCQLMSIC